MVMQDVTVGPDRERNVGPQAGPRSGASRVGRADAQATALVLVDARVPQVDSILDGLTVSARAVRIAAERDGLAQLLAAARAAPGRRLAVICHGEPGALSLGDRPVTAATLAARRDELAALGRALAGAPIELYACSLATGSAGQAFLAALEDATGSPVAAAAGPVGGTDLGGSWTLDAGYPVPRPALNAAGLAGLQILLPNGTAGTGDWNSAGNWNTGVPGASDSAYIGNGGTAQLTGAAPSIGNLSLGFGGGNIGTLQVTGGGTLTANVTTSYIGVVSGSTATLVVDGVGSAVNTGSQNLALGNGGGGTLTVTDGGTVSVGGILYVGANSGGNGTLNFGDGGAAGIVNAAQITNSLGAGTVNFNHTNVGYVLSSDGTGSGTAVAINGTLAVNQIGTGTTILTGTNTYTGGTTVSTGTLQVGNGGTVGTITGNVTNNATLAFDRSDALSFSGVVSGTGGVTKAGAGTLTLSGANTYTGTTTVSEGTLRLSGGNAIADTATVNVAAGATLDLDGTTETIGTLTGSGTVTLGAGSITLSDPTASSFTGTLTGTGMFTVASGVTLRGTGTYSTPVEVQNGATIAPGNSPGTIATGNLTLASGSTASMEIDGTTAGTGYDQISVTGTVTISGATLTAVFGYTSAVGDSYVLISNDGTDAVTGTFDGLAETASFTSGSRQYRISYAGNDGNDVTLTDIGTAPSNGGGSSSGGSGSTTQRLVGGGGSETLRGGDGADTISAMGGDDQVYGAGGSDIAYGNQNSDTLWGNAGGDTLYGGQDADIAYGNQADDVLYGNLGTDTLYGGQDTDRLFGGQGADVLYGNLGGDVLCGNLGADTLYGGQDADTLSGGAGDDLLVGGVGADRYTFGSGDGLDTIGGFSVGEDVIVVAAGLNDTGIVSTADLLARINADSSGDAILDLGAGNTVTLIGVDPTSLSAGDFLLT